MNVVAPIRIRESILLHVGKNVSRCGDLRREVESRLGRQEEGSVRVNAAAKVESRARVKLEIVIVEDPELKDWDAVVEKLSTKRDLDARYTVRGDRVELPFVAERVQPLKPLAGHHLDLGVAC